MLDRDQRKRKMRGEREKEIIQDLRKEKKVLISTLLNKHPKSSVHVVLKRIEERGDGRYVKVKKGEKLVSAFQLKKKKASLEEAEMLIKLMDDTKPIQVRREAAKDLQALASRYKRFPDKMIDFILDNWHKSGYSLIKKYLLSTLLRITLSAKAEEYQMVVEKIKHATDSLLEVVKDENMPAELREDAWRLLELLEEPKISAVAFELLTRENEPEGLMSFVKEEVKRYAEEYPLEVKRRLYDILVESGKETSKYRRIIYLLKAIRHSQRLDYSTEN